MNDFDAKILELGKNDEIEKIDQMLQDKLQQEPENIELWLRLAVLKQSVPLSSDHASIFCLKKVLALDNNNAIALLLAACAMSNYVSGIDEEIKNKLLSLHPEDKELASMIKYMASCCYFGKDEQREEELLRESISLCQDHVWNYVYLAQLYYIQGRNTDAEMLIQKALSNVKKIYPIQNCGWDTTNVNEFLNERIKGIYLTANNLENIKHCVKKNATALDLKILKLSKSRKNKDIENIEKILETQIQKEPNNISLWLRLATLEQKLPLVDYEKSIVCLEKVLAIDKDNPIALLLTALTNYIHIGIVTKELKNRLTSLHTNDPELNSMLKYTASWFYEDVCNKNANPIREEKLLKESINLYQGHVYNYKRLAQLYFKQGRKAEAKDLMRKALSNVKNISPIENRLRDATDVNDFFNEHIKGTYTANYDSLRLELKIMEAN